MQSVPVDKNAKKQPDDRINRSQRIENKGGIPLMPQVDECEYLLAYWSDIGRFGIGAMGIVAVSCHEINEWQRGKGITLTPWEFSVIRDMSNSYVAEYYEAENPDRLPPFGDPELIFDRDKVGKSMKNAFKSLMQVKK